MNELEEIKNVIKNFIYESQELNEKIAKIEDKRVKLADERNYKKYRSNHEYNVLEINMLGREISELGCKSQELQNKLDIRFNQTKQLVNLTINNLITDGIRRIRKINEQLVSHKKEEINKIEEEIARFATIKRNFKNKNYKDIDFDQSEENNVLSMVEEFKVEEVEPIECVQIEQIEPVERVEIGEVEIEQYSELREQTKTIKQTETDKIEILAKAIVEEIIAEQTKDVSGLNDNYEDTAVIISNNNIKNKKHERKLAILNIVAKIEDRDIVYKAQINNGDEIRIYPTLEVKNILLNDKEYRDEIHEFITDCETREGYKIEKSIMKKIDPTICEILDKYAKKYNQNYKELVYNYVMSFSKKPEDTMDCMIPITYNVSYLKNTNLSAKEKSVISKICKNASKIKNVNVIGAFTRFTRLKYFFKRISNFNNIKALSCNNKSVTR